TPAPLLDPHPYCRALLEAPAIGLVRLAAPGRRLASLSSAQVGHRYLGRRQPEPLDLINQHAGR
ncbi:hypothetical protein, partial [Frankia sp. Cj5]|uniref:hypothetical protein n=1 Tax=Frankia sp. Cj5 TaxID=2880978 RepID=UPI001EF43E7B